MMNSVLIASKQHIGFEGLAALIAKHPQYKVVGYTNHHHDLSDMLVELKPDLLIMCCTFARTLPDQSIANLRKASPSSRVVIVSGQAQNITLITELYQAGANAFLHAGSIDQNAMFDAFQTVLDGNNHYERSYQDGITQKLIKSPDQATNKLTKLSSREKQVLVLISSGYSAKKIAQILSISSGTVEVHRRNIMKKLHIHKSTDLTRFALENNITDARLNSSE